MKNYQSRHSAMIVAPEEEPIFSELATHISIQDEAAGEYVVIEQHHGNMGKIAITPEEWPMVRTTINYMISQCK